MIFQENSGGGNGGNIIINSPIIIAFPKQINEITANASTGNGGNINITTQSILGSDFLNINASSQLGIDGVVEITNPNVDPISGVELQTQKPQDTSNQIIAGCSAEQGNRLVIQGKGGLPENPTQPFNGEIIWEDLRIFSPDSEINNSQKYDNNFTSGKHNLQPAQDWLIKNDGTVILTSKRISNRNMIGLNSTHNCTNIFVN